NNNFSNDKSGNDAQNSDEIFAAHDEQVTALEDNISSKSSLDQNPSVSTHGTQNLRSEMDALLRNDTWDIDDLPKDRKAIGSKWIFKIKYKSSGEIGRYKARLVAQGFGQKEGIDYEEKFLLLLKCQSKSDYSLFTKSGKGVFLALFVYVDDIIITGNNISEIERKYVLDLLSEYGMLTCKPAKTPLMSKLYISNEAIDNDPILDYIINYQKLMGKLIYLTNTRPDIAYVVHCLSEFMHSPSKSHLKIAFKILRYLKSCPGLDIHITKISSMSLKAFSDADWAKIKKQNILSKSSTKAEHIALALVTSEVI
ncbi:ribonuclease H-like domain-containing protein, partial [Tanacetum coccineum]